MKTAYRFGAQAAFALAAATAATAQEDYSTWTGHQHIIINTKASGANVPGPVHNYPLLVRLDSANASSIFAGAQAGGIDIRFGKASGARLRFERERWDAAAKKAEFWVLMDTVKGNDSSRALNIHWGKSTAADSSNGAGVFSSSNGFVGVWHMNQAIALAGDTLRDATGNGHHATAAVEGAAAVPANLTSGIGIGKNFLGEFSAGATINFGAYFLVSNADSALNLNTTTGPFTLSAWANPAVCDATARMGLFTKYANVNADPAAARAYALQTSNQNGNWRLTVDPLSFAGASTTATITEFAAEAACHPDEWNFVAGTYGTGGASPTADANGAAFTSLTRLSALGPETGTGFTVSQQPVSVGNGANVYIGRIHNLDRFFRGGIDEIRASNVLRSSDWLQLDYQTQRSGGKAVSVGNPVVALQNGPRALSGFEIRSSGSSVRFVLPGNIGEARLSILDVSGREVWSRNVASGETTWNGLLSSGSGAAPGSYIARITLRKEGRDNGIASESKVVLMK